MPKLGVSMGNGKASATRCAVEEHQFYDVYTAPLDAILQVGNLRSGHCTKHNRRHAEVQCVCAIAGSFLLHMGTCFIPNIFVVSKYLY